MNLVEDQYNKFEAFIVKIIGRIKAISTSKIKKIIEIKKNWREKGKREDLFGSNPHSKGDAFSRSNLVFLEIRNDRIKRIIQRMIINKKIKLKEKIIYTKLLDFMIGSHIYFLYYINNY